MTCNTPPPGKIKNLVNAVGDLINAVVDVLPAPIATRVHQGRKAIVGGAGSLVTLLTALDPSMFPPSVGPWVSGALVVATAVSTWMVPNGG